MSFAAIQPSLPPIFVMYEKVSVNATIIFRPLASGKSDAYFPGFRWVQIVLSDARRSPDVGRMH